MNEFWGGEVSENTAETDDWRIANSRRFLIYQEADKGQATGVMHLVDAKADHLGLCTPAASMSVCGQVPLAQLEPFNGVGYGERTAREAACLFGRSFCGRCVGTLYAG